MTISRASATKQIKNKGNKTKKASMESGTEMTLEKFFNEGKEKGMSDESAYKYAQDKLASISDPMYGGGVVKARIGKFLEQTSIPYSVMKGRGLASDVLSQVPAGSLLPQLARQQRKKRKENPMEADKFPTMQKRKSGKLVKTRNIDGIAIKGKTRA